MPTRRAYPGEKHFITWTVLNWIDVFTRPAYAEIVIDALRHCQEEKGLIVHAYVIMPSHLHLIVDTEQQLLPDIVRDVKQFTSRTIVQAIREIPESRREWLLDQFEGAASNHPKIRHAQFWQAGYYPVVCYSLPFTRQKVDYIHNNPVKARLVYEPQQYVWSSAQDYSGKKGPLSVDLLF
jgi:REP element-mobilizing transposase RayT